MRSYYKPDDNIVNSLHIQIPQVQCHELIPNFMALQDQLWNEEYFYPKTSRLSPPFVVYTY